MSGLRMRSLLYFSLVAIATLPVGWKFLKPYQKTRIWTFMNPESDPLGAGYHVVQSKIAIGSGRLWGKGYLQGSQNRLEFLPEQHTDFIFSVFAEEWGFSGVCGCCWRGYGLLILLALRAVRRAQDRFGVLLAAGMTAILFWQFTINIGMVTGLLPVVGHTVAAHQLWRVVAGHDPGGRGAADQRQHEAQHALTLTQHSPRGRGLSPTLCRSRSPTLLWGAAPTIWPREASFLEDHQVRNSPHAEAAGGFPDSRRRLIFTTLSLPSYSRASSSRTGAMDLHGPAPRRPEIHQHRHGRAQ